jgi:hypothetical protein
MQVYFHFLYYVPLYIIFCCTAIYISLVCRSLMCVLGAHFCLIPLQYQFAALPTQPQEAVWKEVTGSSSVNMGCLLHLDFTIHTRAGLV